MYLYKTTLVLQVLCMQKDPSNKFNAFSNNYIWEILLYNTISVHSFARVRYILCKVLLNISSSFFSVISRLEILYLCFLHGNRGIEGTTILVASELSWVGEEIHNDWSSHLYSCASQHRLQEKEQAANCVKWAQVIPTLWKHSCLESTSNEKVTRKG